MQKSRLSKAKQHKLIEHFVAGTTARCAADLVVVNHKTAAYYYHRLREIIAYKLSQESDEFLSGEIEVDESYFGGHRKGKRGRGAAGKVPVFGLLKHGGKVYTKVIPDAKADTLMPIIRDKVMPDSIVYSDYWRGYNVLDVSEFKHYRINHSKLFATYGKLARNVAYIVWQSSCNAIKYEQNVVIRNLDINILSQQLLLLIV